MASDPAGPEGVLQRPRALAKLSDVRIYGRRIECTCEASMESKVPPMALTELLKLCEQLYLERSVTTAILREYGPADWEQKYERMLANKRFRDQAHALFEGVEQKLTSTQGMKEALDILLQMLPTGGKPN